MNIMEIEIHGVPIIVEYQIYKGWKSPRDRWGQRTEPDEDASIEIIKVETLNGTYDITDMLSERVNEMIREKIQEGLGDE